MIVDFKVIATDLDRTLLPDTKAVSGRTLRALRAARDRGVAVVAVTARPPRVFDTWDALAAVLDGAICSNGAITYAPASASVESVRPMDVEVTAVAVKAIRTAVPSAGFAVETGMTVVAEPGYAWVDKVGDRRERVSSFQEVLATAEPIAKLLVHDVGGHAEEMVAAIRAANVTGIEVSYSGGGGLVEISAAGVSKATALADWCARRGVSAAEVVAFGDAPNDVPMLAWAGRSYAMANAYPEAVAAAEWRAGSNNDDGVARVVEELLGLD